MARSPSLWAIPIEAGRFRPSALVAAAAFSALGMSCDKPQAPSPAPAASPTASIAASAPPKEIASAEPVRPPRHRKDPATCSATGPIAWDDPVLETAVRRQLRREQGPISRADLKQ